MTTAVPSFVVSPSQQRWNQSSPSSRWTSCFRRPADVTLPLARVDRDREIRSRATGRSFAVALTGYAQPGDRREALDAGFDAHLAKPPSFDDLVALLATVASRKAASAPGG